MTFLITLGLACTVVPLVAAAPLLKLGKIIFLRHGPNIYLCLFLEKIRKFPMANFSEALALLSAQGTHSELLYARVLFN